MHVLVCSDAMARGMDMPLVDHVINYDVPTHLQTYVHRVGRTARAGRRGKAFTLLKRGQEAGFWRFRLVRMRMRSKVLRIQLAYSAAETPVVCTSQS